MYKMLHKMSQNAIFVFSGHDQWQAAIPYVPNTSQVIGDLAAGCSYQFRVSANNSIGMSDPSLPSDYVIIPPEYGMFIV